MVRLEDIAERCGVSKAQVSRALNAKGTVSEETRKKILNTAKKLGYVKNIYAQNLVKKVSRQMAVFVQGLEDDEEKDFVNNNALLLLQGINTFVLEHGYELSICLKNKASDIEYISYCRQRMIPCLIVFGSRYDDPEYIALTKSDFPCVSIDIVNESKNQGCVVVNNSYYAQHACNALIQAGCRNIGLIMGHEHAHVTHERQIGYRRALAAAGIPFDEDLCVCANFDIEMAKLQTKALLKTRPEIDGIFCMSDQMAMGCMEAIKATGKRVPEDILIFSFDGNTLAKYVTPTLSTIEQDFRKKGYAAAKMLDQLLLGESDEKTVVIPCNTIVRQSSQRK